MKPISKAEFLKLVDDYLPEDAQICVSSSMCGDAYEITDYNMNTIFVPSAEQDPDDQLPGSTHIIVTL